MMKKLGILLFATLIGLTFVSCNDSEGGYPQYNPLITTVRTLGDGDYYFQRDNGQTLYAGDKSRVVGFKPTDRDRVMIWFNLLDKIADYDYNIALYMVQSIPVGETRTISNPEELEALADEAVELQTSGCNLNAEWLTLAMNFLAANPDKHHFTLVADRVNIPGEMAEGYLNLSLYHDPKGDSGFLVGNYVSFDLTSLAEELAGKKGILLRYRSISTGEVGYCKFDLPKSGSDGQQL